MKNREICHEEFHKNEEIQKSLIFSPINCIRKSYLFLRLLSGNRGSTSPPGGNQVDGLPPAPSSISPNSIGFRPDKVEM